MLVGESRSLFEGPVFKMVIPLTEGVSGGVIAGVGEGVIDTVRDTVNVTIRDTVKERMIRMIVHLYQHPGLKSKELAKVLDVSEVSVPVIYRKLTGWKNLKELQKPGLHIKSGTA